MKDLNYSEIYERIFGFFSDLPNYFIAYQGDSFLAIFFAVVILSCRSCLLFEKIISHKKSSASFDLRKPRYSEDLIKIILAIFDMTLFTQAISYILLYLFKELVVESNNCFICFKSAISIILSCCLIFY